MKSLLLALVLSATLVPHDFFISILTIRHNTAEQTLDLTWRMTAHDVEHALENVVRLKLNSAQEHPKADSILNAYFQEHLALSQADVPLQWNWVGKELDGETLYCYLQVEKVGALKDLLVSNTLLQDLFLEQQNIVHVEAEGVPTLSHTFISGSSPYTFHWK